MRVFRIEDGIELGFPGGRTVIRTFRQTGQTRKTKARDRNGVPARKLVGEPTKEVVCRISSLDRDSRTAEKFADLVRGHRYVDVYHGKRDNGCHEDAFARRCDENLMAEEMVARSLGMWICARRPGKDAEEVKRVLWHHPAKIVRLMPKGCLL